MQVPIFLLFRIAVGVLIGIWLVGRFRNPLRAMVVRMMPMKYRIAEKSFLHQARITTGVSALLVLMIAGVIFLGMTRAAELVQGAPEKKEPSKQEKSELAPLGSAAPKPKEPEQGPAEVKDPPPEAEPEPAPAPRIVPSKPKPRPVAVVITEQTYFIQVHAFKDPVNVWETKSRMDRRLPKMVWVAYSEYDEAPYKVLVGPFEDRPAALRYRKLKKLGGFVRPLEDNRLFAQ